MDECWLMNKGIRDLSAWMIRLNILLEQVKHFHGHSINVCCDSELSFENLFIIL